jgi:hypothetical protein
MSEIATKYRVRVTKTTHIEREVNASSAEDALVEVLMDGPNQDASRVEMKFDADEVKDDEVKDDVTGLG